jgi:hypothetical protein
MLGNTRLVVGSLQSFQWISPPTRSDWYTLAIVVAFWICYPNEFLRVVDTDQSIESSSCADLSMDAIDCPWVSIQMGEL